MTTETIKTAQDYLTVVHQDYGKREIVNVEILLERHRPEFVINILEDLFKEKRKALVKMMGADKSKSEIDRTVSEMFRIHMAIKVIEEEVKIPCPS